MLLATSALFLVALAMALGRPAAAAPGEDDTPIANPDLTTACGIDIHVILDESGSVEDYTNDVRRAFRAFTSALRNTGSRMAVSEFSTAARLPLPGAANRDYTVVTDDTIANIFEPYIANDYRPDGSTHWEDAFRVGRYFLPRPSQAQPHLVVFVTDGDPNRVVDERDVTYDPGNPSQAQNEYELKVPLSEGETQSADNNPAKDRAVPNANALKALGSHILTVAVGEGLDSQSSLDRIIDVSGPDVFSGTGTFDISTDDVYRVEDFSDLEAAMRDAAFQLCSPSITVRKLVDFTPDPDTDDGVPGTDWEMTATADPPPDSWVLPPGATGDTATDTTDASGFVTFQWNTAAPTASTVAIEETVQPGFENDEAATACTFRTPDQDDTPLDIDAVDGGFTATVPDDAIVTCQMVNRVPPAPGITIEKDTNGIDADAPPGPFIPIGDDVTWTYVVTNTGNVTLSELEITDDQLGTVTCPAATLAPGDDMTCEATGTAGDFDPYDNLGTVTAVDPFGTGVSDDDPSHYTGATAGINVEKSTNGDDADDAPGPFIPVGDTVTWTYTVTNTGTVPISGVTLIDNQGVTPVFDAGDTDGDGLLDPTEAWTYTASDPDADIGPYENVASVSGTALGETVQDSDPSHYFGEDASIDIEKFVNGEDADTPPGPSVAVGRPGQVAWTYRVENTGNVPLRWNVTDNPTQAIACPRLLLVRPGQVVFCHARLGASAQEGQFTNTATVTGTPPVGPDVTDSDPANYFGIRGAIDLEKLTNGEDADLPPGPFIPVGGAVTWIYRVTNTGNGPLTDIEVVDLNGVIVTCTETALDPGESTDCTGSGTAEAGEYTNHAIAVGETELGDPVADTDPSHHFGAAPGVHLEKDTNGVDADEPPGPYIRVGDEVTWSYVVINSGNEPLTDIEVTDDQGVTVDCPATPDPLPPGESLTCTATGTSVRGDYANTGTVTATALPDGTEVSDDDPSHYFGFISQIDIEKFTNGADADAPTGPNVPVGGPVTWTYQVTNPGDLLIRDVTVVDDRGVTPVFSSGDADGDSELDPGEIWIYQASGTSAAGQYMNTASVTGLDLLEHELADTDPSHYFAQALPPPLPPAPRPRPRPRPKPRPALRLTKEATPRRVRAGDMVRFRLRVRNVGRGTARRVRVCDRLPSGMAFASVHGARIQGRRACFRIRALRPRRSRTFVVFTRAGPTEQPRRVCNTAGRAAQRVRVRRTRACVRVLPALERRVDPVTG